VRDAVRIDGVLDLDQLPAGRNHNLLKHRPVRQVFDQTAEHLVFNHEPGQPIFINSPGLTVLVLGTTQAENYRLEVQTHQVEPIGRMHVLLGLQKVPANPPDPTTHEMQSFDFLTQPGDNNALESRLIRSYRTLAPDMRGDLFRETKNLASAEIKTVRNQPTTLIIRVQKGLVTSVQYEKDVLPGLLNPPDVLLTDPRLTRGGIAVAVQESSCTFLNVSFQREKDAPGEK
jgi:hypothetical protein